MWRLRYTYESILNILRWIPILWNDRDWDYVFIYRILQFKLQNMRKLHEQNQRHTGWKRTVRELRTAEILLQRLSEDNYAAELISKLHPPNFDTNPITFHPDNIPVIAQIVNREEYMRKQDEEALYRLFRRKLRSWWD